MTNLVIGGTGNMGSLVARGLEAAGERVRVLTRSPEKASGYGGEIEAAVGDLLEPATLKDAFRDVSRVFLVNAVAPTELQESLTSVVEARRTGVQRIVYLSVFDAEKLPDVPFVAAKLATERAIKDSGIPFTILRPNSFFQNDLLLKDAIVEHGLYPQPLGTRGLSRVDIRDVADAAVNAMTRPGHVGKTYEVLGPEAHGGPDCARAYAGALSREVVYGGDDLDAWQSQVEAFMPGWMVHSLRGAYEAFQRGFIATPDQLKATISILGREPRTFDHFVAETVAQWQVEPRQPVA